VDWLQAFDEVVPARNHQLPDGKSMRSVCGSKRSPQAAWREPIFCGVVVADSGLKKGKSGSKARPGMRFHKVSN